MNIQIAEYRSFTLTPSKTDDGPVVLIDDPTFGKTVSMPMLPNWVSIVVQMMNERGIHIVGQSSRPNYSYILLTENFETEL